jgi:ATP-dependent exoDNAse (exonuclease V) alpha subunit
MDQAKALAILKAGKNVFLTGSAGAGKTYVLNQYIQYLKERKVPVAVTASTGIAATHMNGMTIHAWSGMGVKDHLSSKDLHYLKTKKYLDDKLKQAQVLIIDEISMLHKNQLDMVNQILQFFKENTLAFGGIQIVFSGDFFQLPPVGGSEEAREKFAFMSKAWLDAELTICYITEQHRQANNSLNVILNRVRDGQIDEDSINRLQSASGNNLSVANPTKLYTHNVDVDRVNTEHLAKLPDKPQKFVAVTKGNDKLQEMLQKSVLTDAVLELKKGTRVMFIKNNYEKGYMNGTLGEVVDFNADGFPRVKIRSGKTILAEPEDWTIQDDKGKTLASFQQVPLRLAWAITIHKSQGMTLDAAEVDLSKTFERGQGYVALSRLKDLESLYLSGFNALALKVDPLALKADKRFKELSAEADARWGMDELEKRHEIFVEICGGTNNVAEIEKYKKTHKVKLNKKSTYEQTADLIKEGKSLEQMADERGMSKETILSHFGKIRELYPDLSLEPYQPEGKLLKKVKAAMLDLQKEQGNKPGKLQLAPIYNKLKGKVSYSDIKWALLFLEVSTEN